MLFQRKISEGINEEYVMSGKDEKPIHLLKLDFPHCLNCNKFEYWQCRRIGGLKNIYFNPQSYQESHNALPVVIYTGECVINGRLPSIREINDIELINCSGCGIKLTYDQRKNLIIKAVNYIEWTR